MLSSYIISLGLPRGVHDEQSRLNLLFCNGGLTIDGLLYFYHSEEELQLLKSVRIGSIGAVKKTTPYTSVLQGFLQPRNGHKVHPDSKQLFVNRIIADGKVTIQTTTPFVQSSSIL